MPRTGALRHQATPQRGVAPTYARPFLGASELMGFIISYPPDAEIYGEREQAEYFYKVVNGSVRTYKTLKSGRRQIVAFHVPGDVFGLETRGEHTLSADAVAESSLLLIKRSALVALAERVGTTSIATHDERHFRAVSPLAGGDAFRLLPRDQ